MERKVINIVLTYHFSNYAYVFIRLKTSIGDIQIPHKLIELFKDKIKDIPLIEFQ